MDELLIKGDKAKVALLENKIKERIAALMHVYHTVAVHFADLHDTPERMMEKDCISAIVPWRESRLCLYWRLRRLILEDSYIKKILKTQDSLSVGQAKQMLRRWLVEDKGASEVIIETMFFKMSFSHKFSISIPCSPISGIKTNIWFIGIWNKKNRTPLCHVI